MEFLLNNLAPVCVLIAMVFSVMLGIADYMATKQIQSSNYRFVPVIKAIRKGTAIPVVASIAATIFTIKSMPNAGAMLFVISCLGCLVSLVVWAHSFTFKEWFFYGCGSVLMASVVFAGVSELPVNFHHIKLFGVSVIPFAFMGLLPFAVLGLVVSYQNRIEQNYLRWAD